MKRSPLKRKKRIRPIGARALRIEDIARAFREETLARAGNRCELCHGIADRSRAGGMLDAHHAIGRGRGAGWPDLWSAEINGIALHRYPCHERATIDPRGFARHSELRVRIERAFRAFEAFRCHDRVRDDLVHPD